MGLATRQHNSNPRAPLRDVQRGLLYNSSKRIILNHIQGSHSPQSQGGTATPTCRLEAKQRALNTRTELQPFQRRHSTQHAGALPLLYEKQLRPSLPGSDMYRPYVSFLESIQCWGKESALPTIYCG